MKILFVTATYLPTINGVSYHIKLLKKQLEKLGHRIFVLAPNFPGYIDNDKNVLRYFSMPNPFIKNYPLGLPLIQLEKIKKIKPDIIHTHHPLIVGKFASHVAEKMTIPLIFTAHTQYEQYLNYYFPHGYQLTSKLLINDLQSLAGKCSQVICPSPETETRLKKNKIKNTTVIFNGIDTSIFTPPQKIFTEFPYIVYTGRLEKEKNPFLLLNIASELKKICPNFKMIIIGEGRLLAKLSEYLIKYKLENNVSLVGRVSQDILPNIYKAANIFLTTSKSEVMPLSVLEAEACGLPTIALEKSGLGSIVENGKSGYLLKPNPKIVAQHILELVKDTKRLKRFSKRSRLISEKYSIESCAASVEKLYKEVLKNSM
jgi:1,2-diacylglycerol 3-alpha-glucosyltransferase